jgi:L-lactate dehydrogenase complex protein LldG
MEVTAEGNSPPDQELIARFGQRLGGVGGQVHHVPDSAAATQAIAAIAERSEDRTIWISGDVARSAPGLVDALTRLGFLSRTATTAGDVRDQPLGLGIAEAAVAETGSVIMSEPRVPDRAVTLKTETRVIVCPVANLLPSLDEAAGVLRRIGASGASYATFITGPSRTADIERQLTVGVQGPGVYHVILVDQLA